MASASFYFSNGIVVSRLQVADVDEAVAEYFLMEESPPADTLREGIRRATLSLSFVPVRARHIRHHVCTSICAQHSRATTHGIHAIELWP